MRQTGTPRRAESWSASAREIAPSTSLIATHRTPIGEIDAGGFQSHCEWHGEIAANDQHRWFESVSTIATILPAIAATPSLQIAVRPRRSAAPRRKYPT